jgi:hypothetical protein
MRQTDDLKAVEGAKAAGSFGREPRVEVGNKVLEGSGEIGRAHV